MTLHDKLWKWVWSSHFNKQPKQLKKTLRKFSLDQDFQAWIFQVLFQLLRLFIQMQGSYLLWYIHPQFKLWGTSYNIFIHIISCLGQLRSPRSASINLFSPGDFAISRQSCHCLVTIWPRRTKTTENVVYKSNTTLASVPGTKLLLLNLKHPDYKDYKLWAQISG